LIIGVPKEIYPGERRVSLVPLVVPTLTKAGFEVAVESRAGVEAGYPDNLYADKGAKVVPTRAELFQTADIITQVLCYGANDVTGKADIPLLRRDQILTGFLRPLGSLEVVQQIAATGAMAFAVELMPRTTRAQAMDALSTMASIAGYKAVLIAAYEYGRFMPMLMTAAGTVKAARVLVLGAGVAGLQAIATAKRLGAVIEATDVRPAVKEQVESLGAKFVDVPYLTAEEREIAEGKGGYARPMPPDWMRRQAEAVHARALQADLVITTALIPGRPAPRLISERTLRAMKPGAIVVDLAAEQGGNVEGIERGRIVVKHGVKLIGLENLPATLPTDASALYARNVYNFLCLMLDPKSGELKFDKADELLGPALACEAGAVVKKG